MSAEPLMVRADCDEESCEKPVNTEAMANAVAINFRNIVLVFKLKMKGIATLKLGSEA